MDGSLENQVLQLIENTVVASEYELCDFRINKHGNRRVVSISMERKDGRITLDQCAEWNRRISAVLEEQNIIDGAYVVEVSSPGLDRPLRSAVDFNKAVGKEAKIRFRRTDGKVETSVFRIVEVAENKIVAQKRGDNAPAHLDLSQILKANLEVVI